MERPKHISKTTNTQTGRRKRLTLNKQIANAPTLAKKWQIALNGGNPPSAIQRLAEEAFGLDRPSPHGSEWQFKAVERLKQRFTDLLLPALLKAETGPFEELIEAMAMRRKSEVSLDEFIRIQADQRKIRPPKRKLGEGCA